MLACAALPLPDGGTLLTYSDVSDSKRVERALIERAEALKQPTGSRAAFICARFLRAAHAAHQHHRLQRASGEPAVGTLNDKQRDYLGDIRLSGRTLLAIIDDILDLATIDAGTLELKLSPVKVRDVIDAGGARLARSGSSRTRWRSTSTSSRASMTSSPTAGA